MPTTLNTLGRGVGRVDTTGDYPGVSRRATIIWSRATTDATAVELWRDGVTNRRFVIDTTTDLTGILTFRATVLTTTRANSQAWFGHQGFIMSGGNLTLIANGTNTEMPTAGTMTLALTADNTNKSILFTATPNAEAAFWKVTAEWEVMTALGNAYLT